MQPTTTTVPSYASTPQGMQTIKDWLSGNGGFQAINNGQDVWYVQNGQIYFNGQPVQDTSGTAPLTISAPQSMLQAMGAANISPQLNALGGNTTTATPQNQQPAPVSTSPATAPAIPNTPLPTTTPPTSNTSSQLNSLSGVGNSTSGSQLLPGQTSASLGAIMQQLPQTPQDNQRTALANSNNITGYQNLNQGSGV